MTNNQIKILESRHGRIMGKFNDYASKVLSVLKRNNVSENSDLDLALIANCYSKGLNSRDCAKEYLGLKESKMLKENSFKSKFENFLHHPWQDDTEIGILNLIDKYKKKIIQNEEAGKEYLKNLYKQNEKTILLNCSDRFLTAYDELTGQNEMPATPSPKQQAPKQETPTDNVPEQTPKQDKMKEAKEFKSTVTQNAKPQKVQDDLDKKGTKLKDKAEFDNNSDILKNLKATFADFNKETDEDLDAYREQEFLEEGNEYYNGKTTNTFSDKYFDKDKFRIEDIITSANGNKEKAVKLVTNMANKITDKAKAIRRGKAAMALGYNAYARIFYNRARMLKESAVKSISEKKLKQIAENAGDFVLDAKFELLDLLIAYKGTVPMQSVMEILDNYDLEWEDVSGFAGVREAYSKGDNITYTKSGEEYNGVIDEVLPEGKYLVGSGKNQHLIKDGDISALIPKERKKRKPSGPRGPSQSVIDRWEEELKELMDEETDIFAEQDLEAGQFENPDEFESSGRASDYGDRLNKVQEKIQALNKKINAAYGKKDNPSKDSFFENYLYFPTKTYKYLVQADSTFNPYSAGTYPKMYFSSEDVAKGYIENNRRGDLQYKGVVKESLLKEDEYVPSSKEESKEHKDTFKKIKKDVKDGKLDTTEKQFGKDIRQDHLNEWPTMSKLTDDDFTDDDLHIHGGDTSEFIDWADLNNALQTIYEEISVENPHIEASQYGDYFGNFELDKKAEERFEIKYGKTVDEVREELKNSVDSNGGDFDYDTRSQDIDEPWTDPAGGTHLSDEEDPARMYESFDLCEDEYPQELGDTDETKHMTRTKVNEAVTKGSVVHINADDSEGIEEGDYRVLGLENELGYKLQNVNTKEVVYLDPTYLHNTDYWSNSPKTMSHGFNPKTDMASNAKSTLDALKHPIERDYRDEDDWSPEGRIRGMIPESEELDEHWSDINPKFNIPIDDNDDDEYDEQNSHVDFDFVDDNKKHTTINYNADENE